MLLIHPPLTGYEVHSDDFSDTIPTIPLHTLCPCTTGPLARSARLEGIERICNQLYVVRICSSDNQCKRKPVPVSHQTALYAPFPSVCWITACFFEPASGDLVIQPSIDSHDQSIASNCSQASNPFCQKRSNTSASRHS